MTRYLTLPERKRLWLAERAAAIEAIMPELRDYARRNGGRYVLFGSTVRGTARHDSDVDILVDFPDELELAATDFAEEACVRRGLKPDVLRKGWLRPDFLAYALVGSQTIE